ncbi:hypothetical protein [Paenibacillus lautus]|uniref:Glycosyltransferase family 1 protein n=1 Tax=Paenibacillus lautus TaxID=1401 RepID=A0A385TL58_PAELA|nr:hypothetical protein [Paenibacillus lautus]AYB41925.1 hypothetical protein D5F53_00815 [Paenibacillus lautus]
MSKKPKIAYLMHVDWNWIKQRPHFLYEELTFYYNVDLFYIQNIYTRRYIKVNNSRNVYNYSKINFLKKLPLSGRFKELQMIEKLINYKTVASLQNYDYIWVTSPIILDFVTLDEFEGKIVIYDCMDDFLGFYSGTSTVGRLKKLEVDLVNRADYIFTSSNYLRKKMELSYEREMKVSPYLIGNGISRTLFNQEVFQNISQVKPNRTDCLWNLMYIGTIGEWINFDIIIMVLQQIPDVKFTMVGPIDTRVPQHSRIEYTGPIKHEELMTYASLADAFVMPFKVNELVRSVDPVKIYEYILFGKPIFSIEYGEMYKFLPFVNLYSGEKDLLNLVRDLQDDEIKVLSREESLSFLKQNTWSVRAEQIVSILEGVSNK